MTRLVALLVLGAVPGDAADFQAAYVAFDTAGAAPWCAPLDARLANAIRRRLRTARALVERAEETPRPARVAALLARADRRLAGIVPRAGRAEVGARITADCRTAIDARVAALRQALAALGSPPPLPGLPADVAGYGGWLRLNAAPIPPAAGFDPHRGTKDVFVNQTREMLAPTGEQRFPYPDGSTVVKAAVGPGEDFVYLVAIMRKRAGSDPAHADWQFVEYMRTSSTVAFREVGRDAVCWGCHGIASDGDYLFTRLDPAP